MASQVDAHKRLTEYLGDSAYFYGVPIRPGPAMCLAALAVWFLSVLRCDLHLIST